MDVPDLHRRACDEFGRRVEAIGGGGWDRPTPNPGWTVKDLVNHLVAENLWTPPMFAGRTIAEVGNRFDGDVLGDDPETAWRRSVEGAVAAVAAPGAMERTVHLSSGDVPGRDYALQLFADHLVHAWDLAVALGVDDRLDPELVDACAAWFGSVEEQYRTAGAVGPRASVADDSDAQTSMLAMWGRSRPRSASGPE